MAKIAILVFDLQLRQQLQTLLTSRGFEVVGLKSISCASAADAVVVECSTRAQDPGLEFARAAHLRREFPPVVAVALKSSEDLAIEAFRSGVRDFFRQPFADDEILHALINVLPRTSGRNLEQAVLIGLSSEMKQVKAFVDRLARVNTSVLVTGETGTGKEVVARQIHQHSGRRERPMVCVNCAAIPDGLLENELFGHEKGAFTGAFSNRDGKMKEGDGGTIFLDEIGDLSLMAQAKILRLIESKEVTPLGGRGSFHLDLRIIAATNRDLGAMVREQRFRSDLLFRLSVARVKLPPLRERPSDIPLLVRHFLPGLNHSFGYQVIRFSDRALKQLIQYSWPGNVRELRNVMEMTFLNLPSPDSTVADLPEIAENPLSMGSKALCEDEREQLFTVLVSSRWNVSETARKLHWSRMTVYRKLAKYQVLRSTACDREATCVTSCDNPVKQNV